MKNVTGRVTCCTRMVAMTKLSCSGPRATASGLVLMMTRFGLSGSSEQLTTPATALTQPVGPTGTNATVPGSSLAAHGAVEQARMTCATSSGFEGLPDDATSTAMKARPGPVGGNELEMLVFDSWTWTSYCCPT